MYTDVAVIVHPEPSPWSARPMSRTLKEWAMATVMAPAMSTPMWDKPSVQRNVRILREDGVHFVGPEAGWLSCRKQGLGRMSEANQIVLETEKLLETQP